MGSASISGTSIERNIYWMVDLSCGMRGLLLHEEEILPSPSKEFYGSMARGGDEWVVVVRGILIPITGRC